jgi:D-ribose pyranase
MLRTSTLLNSRIVEALASAGHGHLVVVADAGLPLPAGVPVIDLAVTPGLPGFADVVRAVLEDGVFEGYVLASETQGSPLFPEIRDQLAALTSTITDHEGLKRMLADAHVIVRTGECTPFANIVLIAGTTF